MSGHQFQSGCGTKTIANFVAGRILYCTYPTPAFSFLDYQLKVLFGLISLCFRPLKFVQ